ncbi:MAG: S-layer homology domain-containing protein [Clostridia bacterium]|nr:S-layer homology domain-containing protein [Clostridia bacterium]
MRKRILALLLALSCVVSGTAIVLAADGAGAEAAVPAETVKRTYLMDLDFGNLTMEDVTKDKHINIVNNASKVDIYDYAQVNPESDMGPVLAFDYDGVDPVYTCMPYFDYTFDEAVRRGKLTIEFLFFSTYIRDTQYTYRADATSATLSNLYSDRGIRVIKGTVENADRPPMVMPAGRWTTLKTVFDFDNRVFSIYMDDKCALENEPMTDAMQQVAGFRQTQYPNSSGGVETHTYFKSMKAYVEEEVKAETGSAADSVYSAPEALLKGLVVISDMEGYSANKTITRGRFAQILTRSMGMKDENIDAYNGGEFNDVGSDNMYKRPIGFLNAMGWVHSADGNFYPDNTITFEQAAKWLCFYVGRETLAEKKGGWPQGYITVLSELGVLKGLNLRNNTVLTEGETVVLLARLLECDIFKPVSYGDKVILENDKSYTALEEYFECRRIEGVVTATNKTGLATSQSAVGIRQVQIDSTNYTFTTAPDENVIGRRVTAYVKDADTIVHLIVDNKRNKEVVLNDDEILNVVSKTSTFEVEYVNERDKTDKEVLPKDAYYLYNGIAYSDVLPSSYLKPASGDITLIDNNNDGRYEVVAINDYTYVAVKSLDTVSEKIYGQNGEVLIINEKSRLWDGEQEIELGGLVEWDMLQVARNMRGDLDIRLLTGWENGVLESIDTTELTIKGTVYPISPALSVSDRQSLVVGETLTVYFDARGRVCAVNKEAIGSAQVGYIIGLAREGAFENILVKMFNQSGKVDVYTLSKNFRYNGQKLSQITTVPTIDMTTGTITNVLENISSLSDYEKLSKLLKVSAFERQVEARDAASIATLIGNGKIVNDTVRQLITYHNGAEGTISAINTDYFTVDRAHDFEGKGDHGEVSKFYPAGRLIPHFAVVPADVVSFVVPPEGIASTDEDYRLMQWNRELTGFDFELYNMSQAMKPEAILVYDTYKEEIDANASDILIVNKVYKAANADGNPVNGFDAYSGGKLVSYITEDEEIGKDLKVGDIIQMNMNKDVVTAINTLATAAGAKTQNFILNTGQRDKASEYHFGVLSGVEKDALAICGQNTGTADAPVLGMSYPFTISSKTRVYLFDITTNKLHKGTVADIASFAYDTNPAARVLIRARVTSLEDVFIYFES